MYLQRQCAAVIKTVLPIIAPPQKCLPRLIKLTIKGNSPISVLSPPTILPLTGVSATQQQTNNVTAQST